MSQGTFILTSEHSEYRHHLYDIDTLEDVLLYLTDNEVEAKRIATIASHMKIGEVFSNHGTYLKCVDKEKYHAN